VTWYTRAEASTSHLGDALQVHVSRTIECRTRADAGDRAARRLLDSRDLGERVAAAFRDQNPRGDR